jgi:D-alanyl-lipoteichoic acid acyltransferase DltB (MBOAT superfamily)
MLFNSVTFLLFLVGVVALYWVLPRRARLWMLFLSSLTFYGFWRWEFLPVMLASAVTDYWVSIAIYRSEEQKIKKRLLSISLLVNLGFLFYFKYLLFFADNVFGLMDLVGVEAEPILWNIILPLGISFYTFQTISYSVDVYRGFIEPERDFVVYGCYVTFFPQLVAGPVLRAREVIPQLTERPPFRWEDLSYGVRRILYGLFLKVVIADNIAPFVDDGYAMPVDLLSALDVWTLAFLFGLQIYFDFSAYSHIAIGAARMMGLVFPENFAFPYAAVSPRDFWKRWHISLSSWIRDYIYLPLSGVPVRDRSTGGLATAVVEPSTFQKNKALFLTWAIMGLWHGAAWTFVLWGVYHAVFIYVYRLVAPRFERFSEGVRTLGGWAITLPVAMLSWIPFRAEGLGNTFTMYGTLFDVSKYTSLGMHPDVYLVTALLTLGTILAYLIRTRLVPVLSERYRAGYLALETVTYSVAIALVFIFLRPIAQFIYFQF